MATHIIEGQHQRIVQTKFASGGILIEVASKQNLSFTNFEFLTFVFFKRIIFFQAEISLDKPKF